MPLDIMSLMGPTVKPQLEAMVGYLKKIEVLEKKLDEVNTKLDDIREALLPDHP